MSHLALSSNFPHWTQLSCRRSSTPCPLTNFFVDISEATETHNTERQQAKTPDSALRIAGSNVSCNNLVLARATLSCCKPASLMQYKLAQFRADFWCVVSAVAPLLAVDVDVQPSGRLRLYGGPEHPSKCLRRISPSSPAISSSAGRAPRSSRTMIIPDCKVCSLGLSPKSQCQDTKSRSKPCTSRLQNVLQLAFERCCRAPAACRLPSEFTPAGFPTSAVVKVFGTANALTLCRLLSKH